MVAKPWHCSSRGTALAARSEPPLGCHQAPADREPSTKVPQPSGQQSVHRVLALDRVSLAPFLPTVTEAISTEDPCSPGMAAAPRQGLVLMG